MTFLENPKKLAKKQIRDRLSLVVPIRLLMNFNQVSRVFEYCEQNIETDNMVRSQYSHFNG